VTEVEAGGGFVDVVGVVEDAGEFEGAFEDDEGGVVAALAEVEARKKWLRWGRRGGPKFIGVVFGMDAGDRLGSLSHWGGWFELWSGPLGLASKRVRRGVYGGVQEF